MKTFAKRAVVTTAAASLCITGFTAVASAHGGRGGGSGGGGRGAGAMEASAFRNLLHADGVVKNTDGTFSTKSEQRGKASGVSAAGITVTSDDAFARSYVVDSATKVRGAADVASIAAGTVVVVVAKKTGDTWTATSVSVPGAKKPKPSPSASPSASA
jgi:hypothetical protein